MKLTDVNFSSFINHNEVRVMTFCSNIFYYIWKLSFQNVVLIPIIDFMIKRFEICYVNNSNTFWATVKIFIKYTIKIAKWYRIYKQYSNKKLESLLIKRLLKMPTHQLETVKYKFYSEIFRYLHELIHYIMLFLYCPLGKCNAL